jgi:hypothetical protein
LRRLHIIVDNKASAGKAGSGAARNAADILGLSPILTDQFFLDWLRVLFAAVPRIGSTDQDQTETCRGGAAI